MSLTKENELSIGITYEDDIYIWGLVNSRRNSTPKLIESCGQSLFDIYIKYAKSKLTFKTITTYDKLSVKKSIGITTNAMDERTKTTKSSSIATTNSKPLKTLDDYIDLVLYPALYWTLFDDKIRNKVRMVRVFGKSANKVIFATNADKVYGYGFNRDLTLGLGTTDERIRRPVLNRYLSYKRLVDIVPGFEHCLGLTADGKCYAWGTNKYGQLGIGHIENSTEPKLIEDLVDVNIVNLCCGAYHSMALTNDGELFSWGHNTFAQLGDCTYNTRYRPTQVLIPAKVQQIAAGTCHCLALTEDGEVYVWGNNTTGQLGRDPKLDKRTRLKPMSPRPRLLTNIPVIVKVACGQNHNLMLAKDGSLYSCGENSCGQIGNGTTDPQYTPLKVELSVKIKDIIAQFENNSSIAVTVNDKCYIWGSVYNRNIYSPALKTESAERMLDLYMKYSSCKMMYKTLVVNDIDDVIDTKDQPTDKDFESEFNHMDVTDLMRENNVNDRKHLDEVLDAKLFPILESTFWDNLSNTIRLLKVSGQNGSKVIFITKDDNVYAFGNNIDGCLGLDTEEKNVEKPTKNTILSGQNVIDIVCGEEHCIALTSSGICYAWGQNNFGQLGIGKDWHSRSPKLIEELTNQIIVQISCGAHHTLALTKTGQVGYDLADQVYSFVCVGVCVGAQRFGSVGRPDSEEPVGPEAHPNQALDLLDLLWS